MANFTLLFRLTERHASIDKLSAELDVLKTEHVSLQEFLKKSSEKETKQRMELEKKHAREMAELAEEVKENMNSIKTLLAKAKTYTAEAEAINKIIFRKDFVFLRLPLLRSP
jgi:predicted nuclease with TOPRIM domain